LPRHTQVFGWLMLAFVSTVAGNFTLVGSAANIIVAEKASRHPHCAVHIDAVQHFLHCAPITLVCISSGVLLLFAEAALFL
jgi:Na+/H+ antiporter NhaD/arsenite permease-like protein